MQVSRKEFKSCPLLSVLLRANSTVTASGSRDLVVRVGFRRSAVAFWEEGGGGEMAVSLLLRLAVLVLLHMEEEVVVHDLWVDAEKEPRVETLLPLL